MTKCAAGFSSARNRPIRLAGDEWVVALSKDDFVAVVAKIELDPDEPRFPAIDRDR